MLASLAQEQWPCFVRFGAAPCYRHVLNLSLLAVFAFFHTYSNNEYI
jgi:hypothetical protein